MKSTEDFKKVVNDKLQEIAGKDPLFAASLKKENKTIEACINYILVQVKNSGCNGFSDDEIFNMAIHYYDEDKIEVGAPIDCQVVVNHKVDVELTPEEIQTAKQEAIERVISDEKDRIRKKSEKKKAESTPEQPSLF
jgi:hypothetical protein